MKKKVAKLVLWSPMTRVVVNEDTSYEEIIEAAKSKFKVILENDYTENIEDVIDDLECPAKDEEVLDNKFKAGDKAIYSQVGALGWEDINEAEQAQLTFGQTVTIQEFDSKDNSVKVKESVSDIWISSLHFTKQLNNQ
jgi:hypothetical protein